MSKAVVHKNIHNMVKRIDTLSPSKDPKPTTRGRALRRSLLSASMRKKAPAPAEATADNLSECNEEDNIASSGLQNYDVFNPFTDLDDEPLPSSSLSQIASQFERGVNLIEKKNPLRYYARPEFLFSGSDAVSFAVNKGYAPSRSAGLKLCRRLAYECALFEHVSMDCDLEDRNDAFYRFTPPHKREIGELCRDAVNWDGDEECPYNLDYISEVFEEGVEVGPHVYHYRTYKDTFVGRDAVTFLVRNGLARTRQDAVRVGNMLMKADVFRHCRDDHVFKDKFLFYRFVPHKRRRRLQKRDSLPVESLAERFLELVRPSDDPNHPFKNTFCGSAAVDAMIQGRMAASRLEAVEMGQKLAADLKLFFCVYDNERPFMDNPYTYYQYYQRDAALMGNLDWLQKGTARAEGRSERETESIEDVDLSNTSRGSLCMEELFRDLEVSLRDDELSDGDVYDDTPIPHPSRLNDRECDGGPVQKSSAGMSAFNMSMQMMLEDDDGEDEASSSDLGSVASDLKNSSVVDGLLNDDSARYFDKYGFAIDREADTKKPIEYLVAGTESALHKKYAGCDLSDEEWGVLLDECEAAVSGTLPKAALTKVKLGMRLGLSDCHRQRAWTLITGVDILLPKEVGRYRSLVKQGFRSRSSSIGHGSSGQTLRGIIERDLHRTFPRHYLFCGVDGTPNEEGDDAKAVAKNTSTDTTAYADESGASQESSQLERDSSISTVSDVVSSYQEMSERSGPATLRRLLYAYSVYDPEVVNQ